MAKTTGTELATKEQAAIMKYSAQELQDIIKANLGDDGISPFELDMVKVPSGTSSTFEVPSLDGMKSVKELDAVIVAWKTVRAFYEKSYDEAPGEPPTCASDDGKIGEGDPQLTGQTAIHACENCPNNEWDSGAKGRGKACAEKRLLFILPDDHMLPLGLVVPPTSLKVVRTYFRRLSSFGKPFYAVRTRFTLEKDKNDDGLSFNRVVPEILETLSEEEYARYAAFNQSFTPIINRTKATDIEKEAQKTA